MQQSRMPKAIAVFKNRNFALLWSAQFISQMGEGLTAIAAGLLVYRETESAASVGLVMVATTLPTLLVGLIAGVFVDRYNRKWIMMSAEILRGILIIMLPFLVSYGLIWLYVLIFISSAIKQFFDPAQASVLPEVATDEELAAANSMMTISTVGSTTVGFAAAGLIAQHYSIDWAFYFDGITYLFSALLIMLVKVKPLAAVEDTSVRAVFTSLREGLEFVSTSVIFRSLIVVGVVIGVSFGLWNAISLPFTLEKIGASEAQFGLLEGIFSIGFVLGSAIMAGYSERLREGQWLAVSYFGMGLIGLVVAGLGPIYIYAVLSLAMGALNAPSYVGRSLLYQRNTTRDIRGRVSSIMAVIRDLAFMSGMLLAFLADWIGLRQAAAISAVLTISGAGLTMVLPGLVRPTAEWLRTMATMKDVATAPALGPGRQATLADIDKLVGLIPAFNGLGLQDKRTLAEFSRVYHAPESTAVVRTGDSSSAAYFLLEGRTVASATSGNEERILEVHNAGDFFGEIAAIYDVPRTANVTTEMETTLLEVPSETLTVMTKDPELNAVFLAKIAERMPRLDVIELPRLAGFNQGALREIRSDFSPAEAEPVGSVA